MKTTPDNIIQNNSLTQFVTDPRPFTAQNAEPYMSKFQISQTILEF